VGWRIDPGNGGSSGGVLDASTGRENQSWWEGRMKHRVEEQVALLMRGSEFGDPQIRETMAQELQQRLFEAEADGRRLRVYCGYDATRPDLHLGHTVTLRKLREFQDLGHEATFLIGDFTTRVGDPSDRDGRRPPLSEAEIVENAKTYAEQAFKILDRERTRVRYNSEWLGTLGLAEVIQLASHFTVQQFLTRDSFQVRLERGNPIWLHEFFYALLQGYDAVALRADVQLGATEQLFNLLAGRKLQEAFGQRPQVCITFPVLVGTDGHTRMSKSAGNYIGIAESAESMYGKVMSIPDGAMSSYVRLVTRWTEEAIARFEDDLEAGRIHPMEAKKKLAWEIADCYHGADAAAAAADHFRRVHQEGRVPRELPEFSMIEPMAIPDLLVAAGLCRSRSQGRRLVEQGAVRIDGQTVPSVETVVMPGGGVLQAGKRRFVRLVPGT
jgi:tyrosyl-tRNA synthetase